MINRRVLSTPIKHIRDKDSMRGQSNKMNRSNRGVNGSKSPKKNRVRTRSKTKKVIRKHNKRSSLITSRFLLTPKHILLRNNYRNTMRSFNIGNKSST